MFNITQIVNKILNVKDQDVLAELLLQKAELQAIKQKLNGTVNTQLTGRNVEPVYFFNAHAITDTNLHSSGNISLGKYKGFSLLARNSHNQPVRLEFVSRDLTGIITVWNGTSWVSVAMGDPASVEVPASSQTLVLNTKLNFLNDIEINLLEIRASCITAPTSGSLTILSMGSVN